MKILFECLSSHDDACGCNYALVDFSPKTAREFLDRYKRFMKLRSSSGACDARWPSCHANYFSLSYVARSNPGAQPSGKEMDRLAQVLKLLASTDHVVVPDDFEIPDSLTARTERSKLAVCSDGVWFTCIPMDTDVTITTCLISRETLMKMAAMRAAKSKKEVKRG